MLTSVKHGVGRVLLDLALLCSDVPNTEITLYFPCIQLVLSLWHTNREISFTLTQIHTCTHIYRVCTALYSMLKPSHFLCADEAFVLKLNKNLLLCINVVHGFLPE